MENFLPVMKPHLENFNKNWGWFLGWGILLVILGVLAISYAASTTLISIIFLGALLIISGVLVSLEAFQFWWGKWGVFFAHIISGILYFILGIMLIKLPVLGSLSLTLLLSIGYIALGLFRIIYSLSVKLPSHNWRLFNGVLTLILGGLILAGWPLSGLFVIGLFIGIDLLFCGWVYITMALSAKKTITSKGVI